MRWCILMMVLSGCTNIKPQPYQIAITSTVGDGGTITEVYPGE